MGLLAGTAQALYRLGDSAPTGSPAATSPRSVNERWTPARHDRQNLSAG